MKAIPLFPAGVVEAPDAPVGKAGFGFNGGFAPGAPAEWIFTCARAAHGGMHGKGARRVSD